MKKSVKFFTVFAACMLLFCATSLLAACSGNYIDKISVKGQTSYMTGEGFGGATLTVTYSSGKREQVEVTEDMLSGFDTSVAGVKTVVVSYCGKNVTFDITVSDLYAKEIAVSEDSTSEYFVDSNYTDGDANIIVSYTDGSSEIKSVTRDMISGFDTASEGKKTVSVGYGALKAEYEISVRYPYVTSASVNDGTKLFYRVGNEFDSVILNVVYETGDSDTVIIDDINAVSGFDTSSTGTKNISVTYRNRTIGFVIEVAKAIKSAAIKSYDNIYAIGDEFKSADLDVVYDDDSSDVIDVTEEMLTEFDTSTVGTKTVRLDFEGINISYTILVAGKFINNGDMNKFQVEDENFVDLSGAQLQSGATSKFENTTVLSSGEVVSNGSEGYNTANISVKGNKIVLRFISDTAGIYKLGLRAQSGSGAGRSDQDIQAAFKVHVNDTEVSISGTIEKACTGNTNWKDMRNWTLLDSICEIEIKEGLNEIEFAFLGETADTMRLPNIDYFTLTSA